MCDHDMVLRRTSNLLAVSLVAVLAGCGQARDAATDTARNAAAEAVKRRICAPVQDGQISAQDKQVLSGLVSTAKSAGVPAEITTPLDEIVRAGDQAPAESVTALRKACR